MSMARSSEAGSTGRLGPLYERKRLALDLQRHVVNFPPAVGVKQILPDLKAQQRHRLEAARLLALEKEDREMRQQARQLVGDHAHRIHPGSLAGGMGGDAQVQVILAVENNQLGHVGPCRFRTIIASGQGYTTLMNAEEWRDVDPDLFEKTIRPRGRPAILRGLVQSWPAAQAGRTSPEALIGYLRTFYAGQPAPLFEGAPEINGRFFYNDDAGRLQFPIARARRSRTCLIGSWPEWAIRRLRPCMPARSRCPSISRGSRAANHLRTLITVTSVLESIWIGNRTCIAAHFDNTENIACVVAGTRRFTMFPPDQISNLYVGPLDLTPAGQPVSLVDIRNPDLERFPRFAAALEVAEVAELGPGDAVYVPALWWHHVEALDDFNVLVNYWWREVPEYFDSPSAACCIAC